MTKRSELSGGIFGELQVIGLSEISRNGHSRWHVKCSCGTEKTSLGTHLLSGKTISCGCMGRKGRPRNFKGIGEVPLSYYKSIIRGAKGDKGRSSISFNISLSYISDLYDNQNGLCAYTKMPIDFRAKTASLDRIDSSIGYVYGNVQWIHKDINMMKRHYSESYFIELCRKVSDGCEVVDLT